MGSEINTVIDHLCEKFGATASELIPEIARMKTVASAFCVVVELVIFIALVMTLKAIITKVEDEEIKFMESNCTSDTPTVYRSYYKSSVIVNPRPSIIPILFSSLNTVSAFV